MVLINGIQQDSVDVADRGFQYGDGLFETLQVSNAVPLFLGRHINRLRMGCTRLSIPYPQPRQLAEEVHSLCQQIGNGILKIILTRGKGGRGYRSPNDPHTTRILSTYPDPGYPKELKDGGVRARICQTRLGLNPALGGLKHLNRLEQVVARGEWDDPNIVEGLMLDTSDNVVEGTMTNLFLVKNGCIYTPVIDHCGVEGIMRNVVIECAKNRGIQIQVARTTVEDLLDADELFLTNSLIEIWPVARLDNQLFIVGPWATEITQWIEKAKQQELNLECTV